MSKVDTASKLYLGKTTKNKSKASELLYDMKNLTTHGVCVGMTGSGKTGLGIALLEEIGLKGLPALIIDPKGDLCNLLLTFPHLSPEEFLPWIDVEEAKRKGDTAEQYAEEAAKTWKEGLAEWGEGEKQIQQLRNGVDLSIYTPASNAGLQISILKNFAAPPEALMADSGAFRDYVQSTASSVLCLLGIDADPIKSREHILISNILDHAWQQKKDLELPALIQQIQKPPFDKIGVFATETFYPQKERQALAMRLNNLLASPGFQSWMEGTPLDINNLLFNKDGKPKLSILSIAHLSDPERMFFVTLFLNELISWMRRQTGTSNLHALLYMDEIFGYFPSTSNPPSKLPMITLLKQARAFGLGIVLATQNPVDLDYKGLANCGTWFIGRLQTERDKAKVIEGLTTASNGSINTHEINEMIAACGKRIFILHSVALNEPQLFETRWTLSYLRGPLTQSQIHELMKDKEGVVGKSNNTNGQQQQQINVQSSVKMSPPINIEEYFLGAADTSTAPFQPYILGIANLHFFDQKRQVNTTKQVAIAAELTKENSLLWESGDNVTSMLATMQRKAPNDGQFGDLPSLLMQAKSYTSFDKSFLGYLLATQTIDLFESPDTKLSSTPNESEADFRKRIAAALNEKAQDEEQKIRERYSLKINNLNERLRKAKEKADQQQANLSHSKLDTFISVVIAILNTVISAFSRKRITKESLSQASTSMRKVGRISKEQELAESAENSVETIQTQLQDLQSQVDREISQIRIAFSSENVKIEKVILRLKKSDITVDKVALLWRQE